MDFSIGADIDFKRVAWTRNRIHSSGSKSPGFFHHTVPTREERQLPCDGQPWSAIHSSTTPAYVRKAQQGRNSEGIAGENLQEEPEDLLRRRLPHSSGRQALPERAT